MILFLKENREPQIEVHFDIGTQTAAGYQRSWTTKLSLSHNKSYIGKPIINTAYLIGVSTPCYEVICDDNMCRTIPADFFITLREKNLKLLND